MLLPAWVRCFLCRGQGRRLLDSSSHGPLVLEHCRDKSHSTDIKVETWLVRHYRTRLSFLKLYLLREDTAVQLPFMGIMSLKLQLVTFG